jgi:hypothetical protein
MEYAIQIQFAIKVTMKAISVTEDTYKQLAFFPEKGTNTRLPDPSNTRWPDSKRGYPAFLIRSGIFSARSNRNNNLPDNGNLAGKNETLNLTVDSVSKTFSRDYSVCEGNYTLDLTMFDFRVLLELLEIAKRSDEKETLEVSPNQVFKGLGWNSVGGSAYSDLEASLERLATTHFKVKDDSTGTIDTLPLIESIDTGSMIIGQASDLYTFKIQHKGNRYRKYEFTVGPLLQALINYAPLARINPKVMDRIGRSKVKQWLYTFYSTHGGNGERILEYKISTLLNTCGVLKDIDNRVYQYSQDTGLTRTQIQSHKKRLIREKAYSLLKIVSDLSTLGIFKTISFEDSTLLNSLKKPLQACTRRKLRVIRYVNKVEELLFSDQPPISEMV